MTIGKSKYKKILIVYVGLLAVFLIYDALMFGLFSSKSISTLFSMDISILILVIVISIVFFIIDFLVYHMISQGIVLFDFKYILSGKIMVSSFLIGAFVAIMEEFFFRYAAYEALGSSLSYLLLSSLAFGAVHITFGYYNVISKAFLGLFLGYIYILTRSLLATGLFHLTYNLFIQRNRLVYGREA